MITNVFLGGVHQQGEKTMHIYKGKDVATAREIQEVNGVTRTHLYNRFRTTRKNEHLEEGIDYFLLSKEEALALPFRGTKVGGYNAGMMLYTAEGYKKIFRKNFNKEWYKKLFSAKKGKAAPEKEIVEEEKKETVENVKSYERSEHILNHGFRPTPKESVNDNLLEILKADREAYMHMIDQQNAQITSLINLVSNIFTVQVRHEPLEPELVVIDSGKVENPRESIQGWYEKINSLVEDIRKRKNLEATVVLSNAYKKLDAQYGLCLEQYRKEFSEIIHKKPTMLSAIYWMETEKNPTTRGLLEDILINMLEEAK